MHDAFRVALREALGLGRRPVLLENGLAEMLLRRRHAASKLDLDSGVVHGHFRASQGAEYHQVIQVAEMPEEDRTERAENETEPKYLANSAKLSLPDGKKCLTKNTASTP